MIAGLYLAAGLGRRFGGDKLLHEVGGQPLFSHSLHHCLSSTLPEVWVVTGPRPSKLEEVIRKRHAGDPKLNFLENADPERGLVSSLRIGLEAVKDGCAGAMVLLADMPLVTADIIDTLIEAFEKSGGIVIPECDGELRHPRIIPARLFDEFLTLGDDRTGADIIAAHRDDIVAVRVGEASNYVDIDHPDDVVS